MMIDIKVNPNQIRYTSDKPIHDRIAATYAFHFLNYLIESVCITKRKCWLEVVVENLEIRFRLMIQTEGGSRSIAGCGHRIPKDENFYSSDLTKLVVDCLDNIVLHVFRKAVNLASNENPDARQEVARPAILS